MSERIRGPAVRAGASDEYKRAHQALLELQARAIESGETAEMTVGSLRIAAVPEVRWNPGARAYTKQVRYYRDGALWSRSLLASAIRGHV